MYSFKGVNFNCAKSYSTDDISYKSLITWDNYMWIWFIHTLYLHLLYLLYVHEKHVLRIDLEYLVIFFSHLLYYIDTLNE